MSEPKTTRAPCMTKTSDASISVGFETETTTVLRTFPSGLIKATNVLSPREKSPEYTGPYPLFTRGPELNCISDRNNWPFFI